MNLLHWLVDTSDLTPHGFCLFWEPGLLWADALSDGATMLAYFSIPLALLWFARKRRDLPHRWVAVLFVCFIVACGVTHGFAILTLWVPAYTQEALAKALTAILSIVTAVVLWPLVPRLLALPSQSQMAALNRELRNTVAEQRRTAVRLHDSEQRLLMAHQILQRNNEELQETNRRFTAALEYMSQGLCMFDRNEQLLVINARYHEIYGLPSGRAKPGIGILELLQINMDAGHFINAGFFPGMDARAYFELRRDVIFASEPNTRIQKIHDGRSISVATRPLPEGGWVLTFDDVTEQQRAASQLQESEQRLVIAQAALHRNNKKLEQRVAERTAELQDSAAELRKNQLLLSRTSAIGGVGGWEYDLATQTMSWSQESYRILAIDPAVPPVLADAAQFLAPEARTMVQAAVTRAMAGDGGWDLELPCVRGDGAPIWLRSVGSVDEEGRTLTGAIQDITDRVTEREALRIANDRLSLATYSIGIWDWDILNEKAFWDARLYALFGLQPDEATASMALWRSILHPDDLESANQALADAVAGKTPLDHEFRVFWRDGTIRHLHAAGRVAFDPDGRATRMVGAIWDVTERHAAEELRAARDESDRALRAKSDFLATMSHEIRSPMSGLIGVLEMLSATDLDAEQGRMAAMAHGSASMLLSVLNDILDFSKIEAGAMTVTPEPTVLRQLMEDLTQPYGIAAERKGLRLSLSVDAALPEAIETDPLRLKQILGNLLSNAIKFTAAGEIAVDVRQHSRMTAPTLRIAVRDTGVGIAEDVVARLFQPFTQADGTTTRNFGGTGLGLSISQKLAHMLEGDITVDSVIGQGSTFVLHLPLRPCAPAAMPALPAGSGLPAPWRGSDIRVLVIDDDPTIRWLTQRQLEKLGLTVDHASDGAAGLAKLRAERYDMVLTDCHMPVMDGVALTRAVRALADPALRDVPIVGLTADVTEAQRARCLAAGMSDVAIKPMSVGSMSQLVLRHLPALAARLPDATSHAAAALTGTAGGLLKLPFDDQIFLAVFGPGEAEGAAWLMEYLDTARGDLAALAASGGDVSAIAHRLAGASFSAGAILLGDAARAVEMAALAGDAMALRDCRAALAAAFPAAEAAILEFLARIEGPGIGAAAQ